MYKIKTLNKISPVGLKNFDENYSFTEDIDEAQGILVRSYDMLDMEFSDNLLAIARAGAGVNNIPLDKCSEKGIVVFNTPGANANAVKELVIGSLIADARNLHQAMTWVESLAGEPDAASIVEKNKSRFAGRELKGKTMCVIGLGAIGVIVANAAEALGMKVVGYAPFMTVSAAHDMSNTIPFVTDVNAVLKKSDYVTIHVPANADTAAMVNEEFLSQMKKGATLVNFSRDKLVDEKAVADALESGKLRRYITDFPTPKILGTKKVMIIPHLGASTEEAEENCACAAVETMKEYIETGNIQNSVNFPSCDLGPFFPGESISRICILNRNISGMLGIITGKLASMNVNIAKMINKSNGRFACTMIDADCDLDEAFIKEHLIQNPGILSVRVIK